MYVRVKEAKTMIFQSFYFPLVFFFSIFFIQFTGTEALPDPPALLGPSGPLPGPSGSLALIQGNRAVSGLDLEHERLAFRGLLYWRKLESDVISKSLTISLLKSSMKNLEFSVFYSFI
jgi:hypothetical protein